MPAVIAAKADYRATDSYLGREIPELAHIFEQRTLDNTVPYLREVLKSLPPNFAMLDVGLGPASITISIAKLYPQATIVGLDMPDALEIARENIKNAGVKNIELVVGSALDIKSVTKYPVVSDGSKSFDNLSPEASTLFKHGFDLVHTHQVHEHVRDPPRLMKELHDMAKPDGGLVCCRELDVGLSVMYPDDPIFKKHGEIFTKLLLINGNDPYIGRKLVSNALKAGFKRENIQASIGAVAHSTLEERRFLARTMHTGFVTSEALRKNPEVCKAAGLTEEFVEESGIAWRKWAEEAEDGFGTLGSGQVVCKRHG
ncbi:methyltransferase [Pyricularia oryzae 70-15]|uniref:Methyltransferase n=3 Tax=Pyricularia oryzae TaxID=318829 RepID=G4N438_PYRO7|nr:methyltransferase [Pyricularia oryzae 70-15]EHA52758.1 methyltransferase [Pyricularia oryzae 70-15]ELQ43102.1 methyltransferase [Pyricularia oryzae Y34]KAI7925074.1 methyltransferase [Pyricularia oryzae]KAI7928975.1 methyltransferase [Pyricularia oryzae]